MAVTKWVHNVEMTSHERGFVPSLLAKTFFYEGVFSRIKSVLNRESLR